MEMLKVLLNDNHLDTWTSFEQEEINNLKPINEFRTGEPPREFIYDPEDSLICIKDPDNKESYPIHLQLPGVIIYSSQLSIMPLSWTQYIYSKQLIPTSLLRII